jgi:hypothetical protein
MKPEKLLLMEQWHTVVALMGVDVDAIEEDSWDADDEEHFSTLLSRLEEHNSRMADPNNIMKAVLQTVEMGIGSDDIEEYTSLLEQRNEEREAQEAQTRIANNPAIRELYDNFQFKYIDSKYLPKHTHFEFTDSNGFRFRGRAFRFSWRTTRIWLHWHDKKGKAMKWSWDTNSSSLVIPSQFPAELREWGGYTSNPVRVAQIIAYKVSKRSMPKNSGFTYPKK